MTDEIMKVAKAKIESLELTQAQLSKATGLGQGHISGMLKGKRGSIDTWLKLLNALNLELTVIEKTPPPKKRK